MLEEFKRRVEALKAGTPLTPSNGMKFARTEVVKARQLRDAAAAEAARAAELHNPNGGAGSLHSVVQAAQERLADAEKRYRTARKSLADAQQAYGKKFLEAVGPVSVETKSLVRELAAVLADAVEPAVAVESFATANGLPINRITSRARRIRDIAGTLKDLSE